MEPKKLPAEPAALYEAYAARDRRFDGLFFIAVASTRIYCRPICPARTARMANCTFFVLAAQAESAGYRPCRRCRPERAPGRSTVDTSNRLVRQVTMRLEEQGADETGTGVGSMARALHVSPRHLRRVVQRELGVTPMEMIQTRRLLTARRLLVETELPISSIAVASGFSSVRRFNDAVLRRYGTAPTSLRRDLRTGREGLAGDTLTIELPYRPPFDWEGTLAFLAARALRGVEVADQSTYTRMARVSGHSGWIRVSNSEPASSLRLEVSPALIRPLPQVISRVRRLFDLEADCRTISTHLGSDPLLAPSVAGNPGLRVPGAFDGFELAVRAILGQQVTVRAAATLAGRLAAELGEPAESPVDGLDRLSPDAKAVAHADPALLARLGIMKSRAHTLIELARAVADGSLHLEPGNSIDEFLVGVQRIRGIGPWTAEYLAMRALSWPDAFPRGDIALRKRLGGATPGQAESRSRAWRPWRSYATMHLWRMA